MGKHSFKIILCLGGVAVALACFLRFGLLNKPGNVSIKVSSLLTDTIDMAELSTAEFKYRGIADIYKDENKNQVRCRVCYNSIVKAGIDMNDIHFDADTRNKVLNVTLPDIDLKVTIIDEQSMSLLPSDANVEIDAMLRCSKEDAENEARQSEELMNTARENLEATIEGLLYPVLKAEGYTLNWK